MKNSSNKITIKYSLIIILVVSGMDILFSQNSDNQFSLPLSEVVKEIELRYEIRLKDPDQLIKDKELTYALWRFRPDVEQTLQNVFHPFDLVVQKEDKNIYTIKSYQYHILSLEEGKEKLAHLSTLSTDKISWQKRKTELLSCIHETMEISKLPPTPISDLIIVNHRNKAGYCIENISIETLPGLYVCASLYKPSEIKEKVPVILCPNGHFEGGRYRPDQQKRCASLAKMGAIAVSYDLFAWGESLLQFESIDHRKSLAMKIQAMNSIRILDYLLSLPEVDPERVGITGGSGGGSQTMLIAAIDNRIKVSVPVVMLSVIHSGGCPCESGIPIHLCGQGTTNVEIAGLFAPNPQLIISDGGDWTANVPELEFPFLQRIYSFYNSTDMLKNSHFPDEGHDYSYSKRIPMYRFMAKRLDLNIYALIDNEGNINESSICIEQEKDMLVFGVNGQKLPENAIKSIEDLERIINDY